MSLNKIYLVLSRKWKFRCLQEIGTLHMWKVWVTSNRECWILNSWKMSAEPKILNFMPGPYRKAAESSRWDYLHPRLACLGSSSRVYHDIACCCVMLEGGSLPHQVCFLTYEKQKFSETTGRIKWENAGNWSDAAVAAVKRPVMVGVVGDAPFALLHHWIQDLLYQAPFFLKHRDLPYLGRKARITGHLQAIARWQVPC